MEHLIRFGRSEGGRAQHITTSIAATLVAAVLLLGLAPPGVARAGEYDVYACTYPDGRTAPADGWRGWSSGGGTRFAIDCASQGLVTELDAMVSHGSGSAASIQVDAPANLSIVGVRVDRERQVGYGQPAGGGVPVTKLEVSAHPLELCIVHHGCGDDRRTLEFSFSPSQWFALRAACDGGGPCPAEAPKARMQIRSASLRFRDDAAPEVRATGGSLLDTGVRRGIMTAALDVTDAGGGVKDATVLIDGVEQAVKVLDSNGGACQEPYSARVPCALTVSSEVDFDTAAVVDGTHELAVVVRDAAGNARRAFGPRTVTFDNNAPTMGDPSVSGQAEEGQRLTCAAQALSGQSPRLTYEWLRSRADGSAEAVIVGADAATYVLTKDDVDRKVRCRLTATDAGGSTTRTSGLSAGPFADGAVVKAAPTQPAQTQPPAAPGGTGTSTTPTSDRPAEGNGQQTTVNVAGSSSSSSNTTGAGGAPRTGAKLTAVFSATGQAIAGTAFGRAIAIRGQLDDRDGAPIADGLLELVARPDVPGAPDRPVATGRSRHDGTFSLVFAARLPTSELVLRHRAGPGGATLATTTLDLRVAAGLTLNATKRVKPRGLIRFSGRLLTGPVPRKGKVIELRARGGNGKWILFKTVRTNAAGTFRAAYRLRRGFRNITYQFQAVARAESGYPYTAGASPVRRTRVR